MKKVDIRCQSELSLPRACRGVEDQKVQIPIGKGKGDVLIRKIRYAGLFSGIEGFGYAASILGWEHVFHCEIDTFNKQVLKYYWPNATLYHDIKTTDFSIYRGAVDVLAGGFPCQPYSTSGKRLGKEDDRHLWPEMLRAIREIKPSWVVGENVHGIISWDGGLVFEEIQADLEAENYTVQPYILPAYAAGAPHLRNRVWFIATNTSNPGIESM